MNENSRKPRECDNLLWWILSIETAMDRFAEFENIKKEYQPLKAYSMEMFSYAQAVREEKLSEVNKTFVIEPYLSAALKARRAIRALYCTLSETEVDANEEWIERLEVLDEENQERQTDLMNRSMEEWMESWRTENDL